MEGQTMTNKQICEFYDLHPNLTLRQLSAITGLSIGALKLILLAEGKA